MCLSCLPRYFQCPPKFGLFAPIHKVIRIGFPSTSPAKAKKTKRMAMGVSALTHSPSSSSISSVSSVASSVGGRPSRSGLVRVEPGRVNLVCVWWGGGGLGQKEPGEPVTPDLLLLWFQVFLCEFGFLLFVFCFMFIYLFLR